MSVLRKKQIDLILMIQRIVFWQNLVYLGFFFFKFQRSLLMMVMMIIWLILIFVLKRNRVGMIVFCGSLMFFRILVKLRLCSRLKVKVIILGWCWVKDEVFLGFVNLQVRKMIERVMLVLMGYVGIFMKFIVVSLSVSECVMVKVVILRKSCYIELVSNRRLRMKSMWLNLVNRCLMLMFRQVYGWSELLVFVGEKFGCVVLKRKFSVWFCNLIVVQMLVMFFCRLLMMILLLRFFLYCQ